MCNRGRTHSAHISNSKGTSRILKGCHNKAYKFPILFDIYLQQKDKGTFPAHRKHIDTHTDLASFNSVAQEDILSINYQSIFLLTKFSAML